MCDGRHIATLMTEVVVIAPVKRSRMKSPGAKRARRSTPVFDERENTRYFAVITKEKRQGIERLLSIFAEHLSMVASRQRLALQPDEPAYIAGAKQYVRSRLTEDITAPQVAQHVHVSRQHFCKVFRRVTGMTFTEYLARSRVERAKELLVDHSHRIAEAAFAAGFQSIPQFNRVFRRYAGMGPSEYRKAVSRERQCAQQKRPGEETAAASHWQSPR
jgi:AraC-like DNA-binding protein